MKVFLLFFAGLIFAESTFMTSNYSKVVWLKTGLRNCGRLSHSFMDSMIAEKVCAELADLIIDSGI